MRQIPSSPDIAIVSGDFEEFSPTELYDYFTSPDLIRRWWPQEAEANQTVGGAYHFAWPQQDWHLRGHYTAREPGVHLGFTWCWDHEISHAPAKQVDIWFQPLFERGSRLAIFHGPFDSSENDVQARQGIIEGWIHYGMNLAGKRVGDVE